MLRCTSEEAQIAPQPHTMETFSFNAPLGFVGPNDSRTCYTPWSVFQDGTGGWPTKHHELLRQYAYKHPTSTHTPNETLGNECPTEGINASTFARQEACLAIHSNTSLCTSRVYNRSHPGNGHDPTFLSTTKQQSPIVVTAQGKQPTNTHHKLSMFLTNGSTEQLIGTSESINHCTFFSSTRLPLSGFTHY